MKGRIATGMMVLVEVASRKGLGEKGLVDGMICRDCGGETGLICRDCGGEKENINVHVMMVGRKDSYWCDGGGEKPHLPPPLHLHHSNITFQHHSKFYWTVLL